MTSSVPHVQTSVREGVLVLEIQDSSLNHHGRAQQLRDELVDAITDSSTDAILDMRHVGYMTSAALLPFVEVRAAAELHGRRVILCNLAEIVAQVLTVSQLIVESSHGHYLEMTDDLDSALALLKESDKRA